MKLFFADTQLTHQPKQYMVHGRIVDPFENPNRVTSLMAALEPLRLQRMEPGDYGLNPILDVHVDPEQALSLDLDRTKVVLAVRIVVLVEGVELRDSVQDCKLAGLAKRDQAAVTTSTPPARD